MAGPYTFDELLAVLYTAADPGYLQPFFTGDYGNGRELFEQLLVVLQRVDQGVDRTLQSMYILPWSGQSAPPAMGAARTQIVLQLGRAARASMPMTIGAGQTLMLEVALDANVDGPIEVETGRAYTLTRDVTWLPGDTTTKTVDAVAARVGYGTANPGPGTVKKILQVGSGYTNDKATIVQTPSVARLIVTPEPDVVVPEHVGQYFELVAGANIGQVRRCVGYEPADPLAPHGGVALLAATFVGRALVAAPVGLFEIGEQVEQIDGAGPTVIGQGVVLAVSDVAPWYIVVETTNGAFAPTAGTVGTITGIISGATFTVEDVSQQGQLVNESATATWRVLDWAADLGATTSNTGEATPGAYPILDALGEERGIPRAPGEDDETYRARVAEVADLVSPNAIQRIGNRIWATYAATVCLREVGLSLFPGIYCDADNTFPGSLSKYAYDLDGLELRGVKTGDFFDGERVYQDNGGILTTARVTSSIAAAPPGSPVPTVPATLLQVALPRGPGFQLGVTIVGETSGATFVPGSIIYGLRPEDRFKLNLDYTEFRAFFVVGTPPPVLGEFGIPYDAPHPYNAFDASPFLTFTDGFPLTSAVLNRNTWQAIYRARAGGVGFDLYPEDIGCV